MLLPLHSGYITRRLHIRLHMGGVAMKRYSTFSKSLKLEPHYQIQFNIIPTISPLTVWKEFYLLRDIELVNSRVMNFKSCFSVFKCLEKMKRTNLGGPIAGPPKLSFCGPFCAGIPIPYWVCWGGWLIGGIPGCVGWFWGGIPGWLWGRGIRGWLWGGIPGFIGGGIPIGPKYIRNK